MDWSREEALDEVAVTVVRGIAYHFGIDDDTARARMGLSPQTSNTVIHEHNEPG